jgi:hypothetical protein
MSRHRRAIRPPRADWQRWAKAAERLLGTKPDAEVARIGILLGSPGVNGLKSGRYAERATLSGLEGMCCRFPRVAAAPQPWALRRNLVEVLMGGES